MANNDILDPDRPGSRSGIRRLRYRPGQAGKGGKGKWQDPRGWSAIKDQLRLTLRRAPEVVINVRGGRIKGESDAKAVEGVLRYMLYISRNGRLLTTDERDASIEGADAIRDTHGGWNLDLQRMRGGKGDPLHPTFNIIFSMPAHTDPGKLLESVQAFARGHFKGHQYLMALHTPETEPGRKKDKSPEHPHVHLILRAEDEGGRRIYIRKTDLRTWREDFAAELRARGIEANASARAERGNSFKARRGAEWHIQKRYEENKAKGEPAEPPRALAARFAQAAQELLDGDTAPRPWELAMAARRRDVVRNLADNAARLRAEGDFELASQVDSFLADLPPLDSERRRIQRMLVEQVKQRLQEHAKGKSDDAPQ